MTLAELNTSLANATNEKSRCSNLENLLTFIHDAVESTDDEIEDPIFQGDCKLASTLSGTITSLLKKALIVEEINNVTLCLKCKRAITDDIGSEDVICSFTKGGDLASYCVDVLTESMLASNEDLEDEEEIEKLRWSALVCDILTNVGAVENAIDLAASSKTKKLPNLLISSTSYLNPASSAIEALSDNKNAFVMALSPNFIIKILKYLASTDTS